MRSTTPRNSRRFAGSWVVICCAPRCLVLHRLPPKNGTTAYGARPFCPILAPTAVDKLMTGRTPMALTNEIVRELLLQNLGIDPGPEEVEHLRPLLERQIE